MGILDNDAPPIDRRELLRLAPYLTQVGNAILCARPGARRRHAQDMTCEEVLRGDDLIGSGTALDLAGGNENIGEGDQ